jgi:hypothetical protein
MSSVEVQVATELADGNVAVCVSLRLTSRELSRVFLSGDVLIHLPAEGIVLEEAASPVPRTGLFLSELAELAGGFTRVFASRAAADAFAASVRGQLDDAAVKLGAR